MRLVGFSFHAAGLFLNLVFRRINSSTGASADRLARVFGDFLVRFTAHGMSGFGHFLSDVVVTRMNEKKVMNGSERERRPTLRWLFLSRFQPDLCPRHHQQRSDS